MTKTVIFDIGNVLMRFSWWEYLDRYFDRETGEKITDAVWRNGWWNELDRGVMTVDEVLAAMVAEHPEAEAEILQALDLVGEACHRHEYAIPWVKDLKARGYQVLFLSNYSDWLISKKPEILDFRDYMDGGIFSSHVKLVKPDPAIYQKLCDTYNLIPAECLFIDDNAANVAASRAFGIPAVHFLGYDQSYPEIAAYLEKNGLPTADA